jgi:DNA-binding NarL/FixJ family response regulator
MIRIALAEEYEIVRWGLRHALAAEAPDMLIVGEAKTADETIEMLRKRTPDVLVIDPTLPDHANFDVLARIKEVEDGPLVVVLAPVSDPSYAARTLAAGAHAYVGKAEPHTKLLEAIRAVVRGEQVMPPDAEALLALGDEDPAAALTNREAQVMEMLARGMTTREISQHLSISVKTADTHRGHVLKKLKLRNASELTRFAVRHGYMTA